ncbi:type II toxin-antitoxin system RatA family toxin [Nocardia sp. NPDC051570]|uniref:type II toxin-antitoxin system RatA family toxin n=1 Tax=Nocardia sp. NPDC051570 TaxID=3364324 RepID=UPI0037940668
MATQEESPMPSVTAQIVAAQITPARLWDVLTDSARFPHVIDHVLDVSGTPDGHENWTVLLNGSKVSWVQRTTLHSQQQLAFEQVTGDLAELHGTWDLLPTDGNTTLRLRIEFHLGIDGLAPLLNPIWVQSFQAYADAMVRAVAGAA